MIKKYVGPMENVVEDIAKNFVDGKEFYIFEVSNDITNMVIYGSGEKHVECVMGCHVRYNNFRPFDFPQIECFDFDGELIVRDISCERFFEFFPDEKEKVDNFLYGKEKEYRVTLSFDVCVSARSVEEAKEKAIGIDEIWDGIKNGVDVINAEEC